MAPPFSTAYFCPGFLLALAEWEAVGLSLRVAAAAVLITAPIGVATAYLLARNRLPMAFVAENLVQLPLVLPPVVTGWVLLILLSPESAIGGWLASAFGLRIAFGWFGAAVAAGVVAFPLMVQTMRVGFEQVDPSWEEAGYVYGGTRAAVFRYVTAPLAGRAIAAGVVIAFARALGEFGATIVLAGNIPSETRTLPLAIFTEIHRMGGERAALRLVVVAILLSAASLVAHAALRRRLPSRTDRPSA